MLNVHKTTKPTKTTQLTKTHLSLYIDPNEVENHEYAYNISEKNFFITN